MLFAFFFEFLEKGKKNLKPETGNTTSMWPVLGLVLCVRSCTHPVDVHSQSPLGWKAVGTFDLGQKTPLIAEGYGGTLGTNNGTILIFYH